MRTAEHVLNSLEAILKTIKGLNVYKMYHSWVFGERAAKEYGEIIATFPCATITVYYVFEDRHEVALQVQVAALTSSERDQFGDKVLNMILLKDKDGTLRKKYGVLNVHHFGGPSFEKEGVYHISFHYSIKLH